jgi:hypothetical protein
MRKRSGYAVARWAVVLALGAAPQFVAAPTPTPSSSARLTVWVPVVAGTYPALADAMARIPPRAPPQASTTAHVYAARGEVEGFAIVVRAPPEAPLTSLSVTASSLTGPEGKQVAADRVEIYRAMYQIVSTPSGAGERPQRGPGSDTSYRPSRPDGPDGTGTLSDPGQGSMCGATRPFGPPPCFIPDGLVPYKQCTDGSAPPCPGDAGTPLRCAIAGEGCGPGAPSMIVPAGTNQQLWVEISVPTGGARLPAGTYHGLVSIASNAGAADVAVALHVWDFDLPASPSFKTAFGANTSPLNAPVRYGWVPREQDYLAKHKVSSVRYGTVPGDASAYARAWSELRAHWGVPNVAVAPFWSVLTGSTCGRERGTYPTAAALAASRVNLRVPPSVPLYLLDGDEVFAEFQGRCRGATYAAIREGAQLAHDAGVKVLTVVNPVRELTRESDLPGAPPAVDVFVASPRELFRESPRNRGYRGPDTVKEVTSAGSELWTYNIWLQNSWGPKWLLDYSPVAYRIGFIAQALGISGALVAEYWTRAEAVENPWARGVFSFASGGDERTGPMNGDSQFIYPGAPVGLGQTPTAHLRLKMLRDGIEDYEFIQILKSLRAGAAYAGGSCPGYTVSCKTVVEALGGTDYSDYSTDSHALQRARKAIGDQVARDPARPRA